MKRIAPFLMFFILLVSCGRSETAREYKVVVTAADYAFNAPGEIPSGWITFVLDNSKATHVHELSISKIPEGVSYQEYMEKFIGSWEQILKELQDGKIGRSDFYRREQELLPRWADDMQYLTSRGLVSPGMKEEKIVYLEPGRYSMECWAKTPDGEIHISKGMIRPLTVTDSVADSTEPNPDEKITLYEHKIETHWHPGIGKHSFAVYQKADSSGMPYHNNIHLIKLEPKTDLVKVNRWLDWYHVGGLRSPAPAFFLGGLSTYHSKVGEHPDYFTVYINEPGEYAWVVEVKEGEELWKKFPVE